MGQTQIKVAIQFSGDGREFKRCYPTYKKSILEAVDSKKYQFDIFISTWKLKIPHIKNYIPNDGKFSELIDLYKPVSYNREIYDDKKRKQLYEETKIKDFQNFVRDKHKCEGKKKYKCRICGGIMIHNQIGDLYNRYKCNELRLKYEKENNFIYNYVIRNRFDNYFFTSLTEDYYRKISSSNILVPESFKDFPEWGDGINDQFFVSIGPVATIYCGIYEKIYDMAMTNWKNVGHFGIPHLVLTQNLQQNNIDIEFINLQYVLYRKRGVLEKELKRGVEWKDMRV